MTVAFKLLVIQLQIFYKTGIKKFIIFKMIHLYSNSCVCKWQKQGKV